MGASLCDCDIATTYDIIAPMTDILGSMDSMAARRFSSDNTASLLQTLTFSC